MGLFANYSFNGSIQLYQMALEAALNDLKVVIGTKQVVVPIYSSSGERRTYNSTQEQEPLNVYPRSTIKFLDMQPDEDRQLNKNLSFYCGQTGTTSRPPVPKIFTFQYYAKTKKRHEAEQIVEQIAYAFSPYVIFRFKELESHSGPTDVRVLCDFRPIEDVYTDSAEPLEYTVDFMFTVYGNLYGGQTTTSGVIEEVIVETNETGDMDQDPLTLWFTVVPEE